MKTRSMFNKPRSKGWGRNAHNNHAKGRKIGFARATLADRDLVEFIPAPTHGREADYLFANCVVLAAAVLGPASQSWAEQLLPSARALDARRSA